MILGDKIAEENWELFKFFRIIYANLICQVVQLSVRDFRLRSRQAKVVNHYSISTALDFHIKILD